MQRENQTTEFKESWRDDYLKWLFSTLVTTDKTTDKTTDRTTESSEKSSEKSTEKSTEKTWEKIVILIRANSNITIKEMAKEVHTSERNVEKHLSNLQKKGKIRRVDGDNGGYWEIIE